MANYSRYCYRVESLLSHLYFFGAKLKREEMKRVTLESNFLKC